MPESYARAGIGVKSIDGVVLSAHEHHVVDCPIDVEVRDPERLGIYISVGDTGKYFAKCSRIYGGWSQSKLLRVGTISRDVVPVGENTAMVGDGDACRSTLCSIGYTGCVNRVRTTACGRSIESTAAYQADSGIAARCAINAPGYAAILRISGHRRGELLGLQTHHDRCTFGADAYGDIRRGASTTTASAIRRTTAAAASRQ